MSTKKKFKIQEMSFKMKWNKLDKKWQNFKNKTFYLKQILKTIMKKFKKLIKSKNLLIFLIKQ